MTFVGLGWADTGATDLHLVPGLVGPELTPLLRAFDENATGEVVQKELDDTYIVAFAFAESPNGAAVNHDTGEVTVTTAAMKGRSFIVTATATQAGVTQTTRIRVNIHNAITRMWLTPSPSLTVRNGAAGVRFSALALFDDGLVGDITNWSPFASADRPSGRANHRSLLPRSGLVIVIGGAGAPERTAGHRSIVASDPLGDAWTMAGGLPARPGEALIR